MVYSVEANIPRKLCTDDSMFHYIFVVLLKNSTNSRSSSLIRISSCPFLLQTKNVIMIGGCIIQMYLFFFNQEKFYRSFRLGHASYS